MAMRFLYKPITIKPYVELKIVEFEWEAGMSMAQKIRSASNMYQAISDLALADNIMECSRAGETELGISLSAFNLPYYTEDATTVETAYQSSKVFQKNNIRYTVSFLAKGTSMDAKQNPIVRDRSYSLVGMRPPNKELDASKCNSMEYYTYIYIRSMMAYLNEEQKDELKSHDGFTDIMLKWYDGIVTASQAYATAMYVGMLKAGDIDIYMRDIDSFLGVYK